MKQYVFNAKKQVMLACFLLIAMATQAQSDVDLQGYVVTNSQDTLYGEVFDLQLGLTNGTIRVEQNFESTTLKFKDVIAYKRGREVFMKRHHSSFKAKGGSFMQVVITGDVILYRLDYQKLEESNGYTNSSLQHDYYIEKLGGELALVNRTDFQHSIMPFIADKPQIKEKVEKSEWNYDDLALIVKSYNQI